VVKGSYKSEILNWLNLINILSTNDIKNRYRRSFIGPFWITISISVTISCIGLVFGSIFGSPMEEFLPFLSVGLIIWLFIGAIIEGGCNAFVSAEELIKQLPVPFFIHTLRVIWHQILVFCHNIILIPFVMLIFKKGPSLTLLLVIPGFILLLTILTWICIVCAIISTRFRDLPQIISSLLQVGFYVTPVIWMPSMLPDRVGSALLNANPFYHMIEIVRAPILGSFPTLENWVVCISISIFGFIFMFLIYNKTRKHIAYWL
jgi:ABC-type polysaccharide/polyol phosphate export permease